LRIESLQKRISPGYSVEYENKKIHFELNYSSRKTLGITVHPDLSVSITAPLGTDIETVKKLVRKRAPWILKQQLFFSCSLPPVPPKQYISGEIFRYMGRRYRLKVREGLKNQVKLKSGCIWVEVENRGNGKQVKHLMEKWYRERAVLKFGEKLAQCYAGLKKYGIAFPKMRIRTMRKRWGSCSSRGSINLNPALIRAPSACIEYVITHELCHLIYHDHSPAFYALLNKVMPDWKTRKEQLDSISREILSDNE
jgi:predicted metal-dependent hydrolase